MRKIGAFLRHPGLGSLAEDVRSSALRPVELPHLDLQGADRGRLLEVLQRLGAAYVVWDRMPDFERWRELWLEVLFKSFQDLF